MTTRTVWTVVLLALVGSVTGWVLAGAIAPSSDEMRAAAADLIPGSVEVTHAGDNPGSSLVVGDPFALVEFEGGRTARSLLIEIDSLALEEDWAKADTLDTGSAITVRYERGRLVAEVRLSDVGGAHGHVQVEPDATDARRDQILGVGGGLLLGLACGAVLGARMR